MVRRIFTRGTGAICLIVAAALVTGLAVSSLAFAGVGHKPVVKAVGPNYGSSKGGTTVTIQGKYFVKSGKSLVEKVTFGTRAATQVHVLNSTRIKVRAPKGAGTVHVTVTTSAGRSAKVSADRYTYSGPAANMAANAGNNQSATVGTAVVTSPSVIVTDANGVPVSGVGVTFAVASGGGSAAGTSATTNHAGIATVGSWTLGAVVGANTLTATVAGLSGSPVTFTATGAAIVLQVQHNGTLVKSYGLAELQALTPFVGYAGYRNNAGTMVGPDAVTGAKVTDIVANALGTSLTSNQSVIVASGTFSKTFSYDRLINFTGFTMYDATSNTLVAVSSLTGPLAAVLIYSDPAAIVMPVSKGPLRFVIADATSENVVFTPGSDSVNTVDTLNVIDS